MLCVRAALAELLIQGLLVLIQLASGLPAAVRADRRRARRWALATHAMVAGVTTLAAHPDDRRAATRLIGPLRRAADRDGIVALAQPRNAQLAATYRRLGFRPVPVADAAAVLYRPPDARRRPTATLRQA